jgi:hypothetical protein
MTSDEGRSQRIPWTRVIAEGAAIVLSILLAFAIDAAWDARQAALAEATVIESLVDEIDSAIGYLDEALDEHTQVMRGAEAWAQVSREMPVDSLARLVRLISAHRTPNLALSSVDALLGSGRLELIRDEALRSWIAAWPGVEEDFDEELQGVIRFSRFVVPDFFVATGVPRAAADSLLLFGGSRADLRDLVGDRRFSNLYYQAWEVSEVLVREGRLVRAVLEQGAALARASY